MSIEAPKIPDRRKEIEAARDLMSQNPLLERDELTMQAFEDQFVVDGSEVDPGEWLHDRLKYLQESNSATSTGPRDLEDDFKKRQPD